MLSALGVHLTGVHSMFLERCIFLGEFRMQALNVIPVSTKCYEVVLLFYKESTFKYGACLNFQQTAHRDLNFIEKSFFGFPSLSLCFLNQKYINA